MKTAVVILNWNGKKLLEKFLPVILKHTLNSETQVIVADNASSDDSVEYLKTHFRDVPLILFDKNYGFAEGYNKALQQVNAEYVVLLNSDVETSEDWLSPLIEYLELHPCTAALQPKILAQKDRRFFEYAGAAGGFIDKLGYPFCRGRILNTVEPDEGQYDTAIPVFWATGACLCIRRSLFFEVGGFDARFFAHMEEIDLCWRLNARGYKVECLPQAVVYHVGAASLNKETPRKTYLNFRNNLLMLYKNVSSKEFVFVFAARILLDILAFVHLLLESKTSNARAVFRAHIDFLKMRLDFKYDRQKNLEKTKVKNIPTKFGGSILWRYYAKGQKNYSSLFNPNFAIEQKTNITI